MKPHARPDRWLVPRMDGYDAAADLSPGKHDHGTHAHCALEALALDASKGVHYRGWPRVHSAESSMGRSEMRGPASA